MPGLPRAARAAFTVATTMMLFAASVAEPAHAIQLQPVSRFIYTNSVSAFTAGYDPQDFAGAQLLVPGKTVTITVRGANPSDLIDFTIRVDRSNVRELKMASGTHVVTLAGPPTNPNGTYAGSTPIGFKPARTVVKDKGARFSIAVCAGSHAICPLS